MSFTYSSGKHCAEEMETKIEPASAKVAWSDDRSNENENIGTLWTDFSQNTGFHGVNKLTPGRNYRFRCLWWAIAVMSMSAYMSYNITKELMNYYSYPTVTSMKTELVEKITFPAVTFCSQSPFSMTRSKAVDPELESYFTKTSLMGGFAGAIDWKKEFLGSTFRDSKNLEWWSNISMDLNTMYYHCVMAGVAASPCTTAMKPVYTNYGLCATFNFNASDVKEVRLAGGDNNLLFYGHVQHDEYVLGRDLAAGIRVILHEPHVHPDAATSSFVTSPGTSTYAVVKKSTYKYLPQPFKAFANRTCIDTEAPDFNNTLGFFDTYTFEHCVLECEIRKVYELCGCAKVQDDDSLQPKCSIFNLTTCYYPKFVNDVIMIIAQHMTARMNIICLLCTTMPEIRQDFEFQKSCDCTIPCSFSTYDAKLSTSRYPSNVNVQFIQKHFFNFTQAYLRDNFLEIRMYYEKLMVQSTQQIAQYTVETIIGNLGGQMGICLGASILTLTELGEFIIIVCLTFLRRMTHSGEIKHIKPVKH